MAGTIRTLGTAGSALALVALLVACAPTASGPAPTPSDTASASPEPSDAPEPSETPTVAPASLTAEDRASLVEGLETGNPGYIGPYLGETVTYILAASECCGPIPHEDALGELLAYAGSSSGWASPIDMVFLDRVRASEFYAEYVPADVVAARAGDGLVVIFGIVDGEVASILVGDEQVLLY